jgi:hypothetical protein
MKGYIVMIRKKSGNRDFCVYSSREVALSDLYRFGYILMVGYKTVYIEELSGNKATIHFIKALKAMML